MVKTMKYERYVKQFIADRLKEEIIKFPLIEKRLERCLEGHKLRYPKLVSERNKRLAKATVFDRFSSLVSIANYDPNPLVQIEAIRTLLNIAMELKL